ncbi:MAG: response regulator transcription factor [Chloroflexi bacterium]|nr:response regulator transcription factor [Chloroflexota bacterium]
MPTWQPLVVTGAADTCTAVTPAGVRGHVPGAPELGGAVILVIDDDPVAVRLALLTLEPLGCRVVVVGRGDGVAAALEVERPAVVVLDLMLPDMHGLEVCRAVRAHSLVPIIVVTVVSSHRERLQCLRAGADDVLTKPYDPEELALRVGALHRRAEGGAPASPRPYRYRGLVVDSLAHTVILDGIPLALTATEERLLELLARRPGVVQTPRQLLGAMYGPHATDAAALYLQISRLRRKLGDQRGQPTYLQTRTRQGYYLPATEDG